MNQNQDQQPEQDEDEAAPQQDTENLQVSEGGGAFSDTETEIGGADAVPDKTTGTAPRRSSEDPS